MIDINLIRENSELVKENIRKKFQEEKVGLVDEVYEYDKTYREYKQKIDSLRAKRNSLSSQIGELMRNGKKDEAEKVKKEVVSINDEVDTLEISEENLEHEIKIRIMFIPNIIDDSVPIGKDHSENVQN